MIDDARLEQIAREEGLATPSLETCGKLFAAMRRVRDETAKECAAPDLFEALVETWRVLDAAGLHNLSNGVQLGPTVWFVKAKDAQELSRAAIAKVIGTPSFAPKRTDVPDPQPLWRSVDMTAGMLWDAIQRSDTLEDFAHHISETAKAAAKEGLR